MDKAPFHFIYAWKDGRIVSISQVERGLNCHCTCPACGGALVAKKGKKVSHHFAHYQSDHCEYGNETALHMAAKEIIAAASKIWIPPAMLTFHSPKSPEQIKAEAEIHVDSVRLEKRVGEIIPDIIVSSGGHEFFIEICVTHPVDAEKLEKISALNISTLEIDLSKMSFLTHERLKEFVLGKSPNKSWKYHRVAEHWRKKYADLCEEKEAVLKKGRYYGKQCPILKLAQRKKIHGDRPQNCSRCKFLIEVFPPEHGAAEGGTCKILCSGKKAVAGIEDFQLDLPQRRSKYQICEASDYAKAVKDGRCPCCGAMLVKRAGPYGPFGGCGNYPRCRFEISIEDWEIIRNKKQIRLPREVKHRWNKIKKNLKNLLHFW